MAARKTSVTCSLLIAMIAALLGFWGGSTVKPTAAQEKVASSAAPVPANPAPAHSPADQYLRQSPAAKAVNREPCDYGLGPNHVSKLPTYPAGICGDRTP
ncbi:MAG TPA: hypothetical protein VG099_00905, partial [Gemmataceae bacterium]|nr:hypothetical protein [Gemmataceae bacterium]